MKKSLFYPLLLVLLSMSFMVNAASVLNASWKDVIRGKCSDQNSTWWRSPEAIRIANNVLLYQKNCGGWPKNINMQLVLSNTEKNELKNTQSSNAGCTIDNGAVSYELTYLSKVYGAISNDSIKSVLKTSFIKGVQYLINMQYDNGGWPQFYPLKGGYANHITYNDNAMINVMQILRHIYNKDSQYAIKADATMVSKAKTAFDKGVECILKTQYIRNGKPTVWCAQHHYSTLVPVLARSYELPSLSGAESEGIIKLLMSLNNPSDEIIRAIYGAVSWYDESRIVGQKLISYTNSDGIGDKKIIFDSNAPDMWGRFYDLVSNRPIFSDRDGVMKYSIAEIGHERRNGYSWYGSAGFSVFSSNNSWLPKWGKTLIVAPIPDSKLVFSEATVVKAYANKYTGKKFQRLEVVVDTNTVYTYSVQAMDTALTDLGKGLHSIVINAVYEGGYTESDTSIFSIVRPYRKLIVNSGDGDGTYEEGSVVTIKADKPRAGREFDKWLGDVETVGNLTDAETTFTIPDTDAKLRAVYKIASTTAVNDDVVNVLCYPNPVIDILTVDLSDVGAATIAIYDIAGREVYSELKGADKYQLDMSGYTAGHYFIKIKSGANVIYSSKLVVQ